MNNKTLFFKTNALSAVFLKVIRHFNLKCIFYLCRGTEMEAPEFERSLSDVWVKVGEQLSLECKVTGLPLTETLWLRDGQEVSYKSRLVKDQICK